MKGKGDKTKTIQTGMEKNLDVPLRGRATKQRI